MIKKIDLFAGCGGLTEGFLQTGLYSTLALVEWEKWPIETIKNRLKAKYKYTGIDDIAFQYDIRDVWGLIKGWDNKKYGKSDGIDSVIKEKKLLVDLIIGGPPCQAYSIAGRIRDKDGMRYDYRNYLFESYIELVRYYKPKVFVFENVPGILSARPGKKEKPVIDRIQKAIEDAGYHILDNLKDALIDFTEYGIPQKRKRIIIIGLCKSIYGVRSEEKLQRFYFETLPKYKEKIMTVQDAIADLPKLYPFTSDGQDTQNLKRVYTTNPDSSIKNHEARYHNSRDIEIFKILTKDIETGDKLYTSAAALKKLYTKYTGRKSNVHKYNVLRWNEPSNTIPAHLYKDGLRHIHPDSLQARSITVREAARLQTFPDDFEFISHTNQDYKMIGNAVPPKFAKKLALAIKEDFFK